MKKFLTSAIVILGFVASSSAQSTATASATAIIISPITIVRVGDMHFGSVAAGAAGGTVILAVDGTRTKTGDVTLSAIAPLSTAAQFTVTGTAGYTYAITLPTALTLTLGATANTMALSNFTSSTGAVTAGAGTGILTGGTQALNVGATLTVATGQAAGLYENASFDVTVNYN